MVPGGVANGREARRKTGGRGVLHTSRGQHILSPRYAVSLCGLSGHVDMTSLITNSVGIAMALTPAGKFIMVSTNSFLYAS